MTAVRADVPQNLPTPATGRPALRLVASGGRVVDGSIRPRRLDRSVYRRRRLVAGLVAGVLAAAGLWAASSVVGSGGAPASSPRPRPTSYVVQPGDTLWSIAERYATPGELPALVEQLTRVNGGSRIRVGQSLVMPRG